MVPKKDRASGGAAIGVALLGLVAIGFLVVVASILINWNNPFVTISKYIYIYTLLFIFTYLHVYNFIHR